MMLPEQAILFNGLDCKYRRWYVDGSTSANVPNLIAGDNVFDSTTQVNLLTVIL